MNFNKIKIALAAALVGVSATYVVADITRVDVKTSVGTFTFNSSDIVRVGVETLKPARLSRFTTSAIDKTNWKPVYSSPSNHCWGEAAVVTSLWDGALDFNHSWLSHEVVKGTGKNANYQVPWDAPYTEVFAVVDLGKFEWISSFGACTAGFNDTTFDRVEFYYTDAQNIITERFTEADLKNMNVGSMDLEGNANGVKALMDKCFAVDKTVVWKKFGEVKSRDNHGNEVFDAGREYIRKFTEDELENNPIKTRYVKMVFVPYAYPQSFNNYAERVSCAEIFLNHVTEVDGEPVDVTAPAGTTYETAPLDKSKWNALYATNCNNFWGTTSVPSALWDGLPAADGEFNMNTDKGNCWLSNQVVVDSKGEHTMPVEGKYLTSFVVVDLGQTEWISNFGAMTAGYGDTTFKRVEFYATDATEINTDSFDEADRKNMFVNGNDIDANGEAIKTLMDKMFAIDDQVGWVKVAEMSTCDDVTPWKTYNNHFSTYELDSKPVKTRFVKIVFVPYEHPQSFAYAERVSCAEIYMDHVTKVNGVDVAIETPAVDRYERGTVDKTNWQPVYASPCNRFWGYEDGVEPIRLLWDGAEDFADNAARNKTSWMSHQVVKGTSTNLGENYQVPYDAPYTTAMAVIDLGEKQLLSGAAARTAGYGDTTFDRVEFYYTDAETIDTSSLTDEDKNNMFVDGGDIDGNADAIKALMDKDFAIDETLGWKKFAEVSSNGSFEPGVKYSTDLTDKQIFDNPVNTRFVKVVFHPFAYPQGRRDYAERVSCAEIYLNRVTKNL